MAVPQITLKVHGTKPFFLRSDSVDGKFSNSIKASVL
jgi:hypothetical protein